MKNIVFLLAVSIFFTTAFKFNNFDFFQKKQKTAQLYYQQTKLENDIIQQIQEMQTKTKLNKLERAELLFYYQDMPKSVEDYNEISKDVKRIDKKIVSRPDIPHSEKYSFPETVYKLSKYNYPAGSANIDLRKLRKEKQITSQGVLSPIKDKIVFSDVYYDGNSDKVSSEVFYIKTDSTKNAKYILKNSNTIQKETSPLITSAMSEEYRTLYQTLTVIDWSADGKKIAVKEKIGSTIDDYGVWQTNLWIYDFDKNQHFRLDNLRAYIKDYYKMHENLELEDYRWDILPLGWSSEFSDDIYVSAYAFSDKGQKFLGIFSTNSSGNNIKLISKKPCGLSISANGIVLRKE